MSDETDIHPDDMPEEQVLPLDDWHRKMGGRMVEFAGYQMPIQYTGDHLKHGGGIVGEHTWTRTHAGLFDVSHMGQLLISGEGADAALEALLPIDLSTLEVGMQRYSLLLNEEGGVLDDLMVSRWPNALYLVVNGATKWEDIAHLREHLPDDVTLNHLEDRALLALQGPKAFAALDRHVTGEYPLSSLVFMTFGHFEIDGVEMSVSRSGYTGEDGFEISLPAKDAEKIATLLCNEPEVEPIGLGARDSLRLEAGLPLYGHDLDTETDPVSARLLFGLAKSRRETGGWMGHVTCAKMLAEGSPTKRVGLKVEGRMPAREGALVFAGDKEIGRVTSGGFSPTLGYPIAMAYVASDYAKKDAALQIEVRNKRLDATVTPMPFVPNNYYRGD
ncbi:glycine cleavage system aminomethyltransferase GcvT [Pontixanthobacter aestiaquae]|uniref:aminomethyltransferase n=1 Tax=Pontixanthobacter aestiaquae TaxID=1509367 RepID=A0A844Z6U7_9SPHN|nr:glycine cleavage system aminomethyltransferase GcvT [Pontixanthobacter aestiaquae]MDN3646428.1 glycine cleavage system aminomethyltransferase GcvT [Pontixanthobacter aestiaquae]MXO82583.1 glycine cleavage system aminomethyltransferase GcvT [Pontixanthobacter aestiaquae]